MELIMPQSLLITRPLPKVIEFNLQYHVKDDAVGAERIDPALHLQTELVKSFGHPYSEIRKTTFLP
jgi:hypothetical protein